MNLNTILLGIIAIVFAIGFFAVWRASKNRGAETPKTDDQAFLLIQNQLNELSRVIDTKLGESAKAMQSQFGESAKIIRDVTEKLTKLDETNKQVINFTDQLQSLQDILKNPKQRGILGEYYLETLLKNVLPTGSYQMQYPFKDGTIVDAVVFVKDKIIPIDSKFSLENYNRLAEEKDPVERERLEKQFKIDLKARIDETAKYVKPAEGTMDFAFMFIPHEAVYYDLLVAQVGAVKVNTRDLIEYAFKDKHVIIVSPTSFLAYLQTVLQGLKALQIEESAKEIIKRVGELGRHLSNYEEFVKKMGTHLGTTVNAYNTAYKELGKIDKDVLRITGSGTGTEQSLLDRPDTEDE
ncbi:MAG: DNA recombination protein RmuC [Candidatus Jorgensenbacteria bacterium]|nr:DNA recombination protein RmuC [Candidatus Jorgensenbacteria bacterium]